MAGTTTSQTAARQLVAGLLERDQLGAGYLAGQRLAVRVREHRVVGAVHDERRDGQVAERAGGRLALVHHVWFVMLDAMFVVRSNTRAQSSRVGGLVERACGAGGARASCDQ